MDLHSVWLRKKDSYQNRRLIGESDERAKQKDLLVSAFGCALSEIGNLFVFCNFGVCFQNESLTATWVICRES